MRCALLLYLNNFFQKRLLIVSIFVQDKNEDFFWYYSNVWILGVLTIGWVGVRFFETRPNLNFWNQKTQRPGKIKSGRDLELVWAALSSLMYVRNKKHKKPRILASNTWVIDILNLNFAIEIQFHWRKSNEKFAYAIKLDKIW